MYGIVLLVIVALVSLLITRVATVALSATGMARQSARFQARSALSGVGFTTSEAEQVVNHPSRRRIVMGLMLIGNVGLVTAIAGLLGTFTNTGAASGLLRVTLLVAGLGAVYAASRSDVVDRWLSRLIARWLSRYTKLQTGDYERLLHLAGEYFVREFAVESQNWLVGRSLGEARLRDEGIVVLGITRADGTYIGVPDKATPVEPNDVLVVYGRGDILDRLDRREPGKSGDADHAQATEIQEQVATQEHTQDAQDAPSPVSENEPDEQP